MASKSKRPRYNAVSNLNLSPFKQHFPVQASNIITRGNVRNPTSSWTHNTREYYDSDSVGDLSISFSEQARREEMTTQFVESLGHWVPKYYYPDSCKNIDAIYHSLPFGLTFPANYILPFNVAPQARKVFDYGNEYQGVTSSNNLSITPGTQFELLEMEWMLNRGRIWSTPTLSEADLYDENNVLEKQWPLTHITTRAENASRSFYNNLHQQNSGGSSVVHHHKTKIKGNEFRTLEAFADCLPNIWSENYEYQYDAFLKHDDQSKYIPPRNWVVQQRFKWDQNQNQYNANFGPIYSVTWTARTAPHSLRKIKLTGVVQKDFEFFYWLGNLNYALPKDLKNYYSTNALATYYSFESVKDVPIRLPNKRSDYTLPRDPNGNTYDIRSIYNNNKFDWGKQLTTAWWYYDEDLNYYDHYNVSEQEYQNIQYYPNRFAINEDCLKDDFTTSEAYAFMLKHDPFRLAQFQFFANGRVFFVAGEINASNDPTNYNNKKLIIKHSNVQTAYEPKSHTAKDAKFQNQIYIGGYNYVYNPLCFRPLKYFNKARKLEHRFVGDANQEHQIHSLSEPTTWYWSYYENDPLIIATSSNTNAEYLVGSSMISNIEETPVEFKWNIKTTGSNLTEDVIFDAKDGITNPETGNTNTSRNFNLTGEDSVASKGILTYPTSLTDTKWLKNRAYLEKDKMTTPFSWVGSESRYRYNNICLFHYQGKDKISDDAKYNLPTSDQNGRGYMISKLSSTYNTNDARISNSRINGETAYSDPRNLTLLPVGGFPTDVLPAQQNGFDATTSYKNPTSNFFSYGWKVMTQRGLYQSSGPGIIEKTTDSHKFPQSQFQLDWLATGGTFYPKTQKDGSIRRATTPTTNNYAEPWAIEDDTNNFYLWESYYNNGYNPKYIGRIGKKTDTKFQSNRNTSTPKYNMAVLGHYWSWITNMIFNKNVPLPSFYHKIPHDQLIKINGSNSSTKNINRAEFYVPRILKSNHKEFRNYWCWQYFRINNQLKDIQSGALKQGERERDSGEKLGGDNLRTSYRSSPSKAPSAHGNQQYMLVQLAIQIDTEQDGAQNDNHLHVCNLFSFKTMTDKEEQIQEGSLDDIKFEARYYTKQYQEFISSGKSEKVTNASNYFQNITAENLFVGYIKKGERLDHGPNLFETRSLNEDTLIVGCIIPATVEWESIEFGLKIQEGRFGKKWRGYPIASLMDSWDGIYPILNEEDYMMGVDHSKDATTVKTPKAWRNLKEDGSSQIIGEDGAKKMVYNCLNNLVCLEKEHYFNMYIQGQYLDKNMIDEFKRHYPVQNYRKITGINNYYTNTLNYRSVLINYWTGIRKAYLKYLGETKQKQKSAFNTSSKKRLPLNHPGNTDQSHQDSMTTLLGNLNYVHDHFYIFVNITFMPGKFKKVFKTANPAGNPMILDDFQVDENDPNTGMTQMYAIRLNKDLLTCLDAVMCEIYRQLKIIMTRIRFSKEHIEIQTNRWSTSYFNEYKTTVTTATGTTEVGFYDGLVMLEQCVFDNKEFGNWKLPLILGASREDYYTTSSNQNNFLHNDAYFLLSWDFGNLPSNDIYALLESKEWNNLTEEQQLGQWIWRYIPHHTATELYDTYQIFWKFESSQTTPKYPYKDKTHLTPIGLNMSHQYGQLNLPGRFICQILGGKNNNTVFMSRLQWNVWFYLCKNFYVVYGIPSETTQSVIYMDYFEMGIASDDYFIYTYNNTSRKSKQTSLINPKGRTYGTISNGGFYIYVKRTITSNNERQTVLDANIRPICRTVNFRQPNRINATTQYDSLPSLNDQIECWVYISTDNTPQSLRCQLWNFNEVKGTSLTHTRLLARLRGKVNEQERNIVQVPNTAPTIKYLLNPMFGGPPGHTAHEFYFNPLPDLVWPHFSLVESYPFYISTYHALNQLNLKLVMMNTQFANTPGTRDSYSEIGDYMGADYDHDLPGLYDLISLYWNVHPCRSMPSLPSLSALFQLNLPGSKELTR